MANFKPFNLKKAGLSAQWPYAQTCVNTGPEANKWTCPSCYTDFPNGRAGERHTCPACRRTSLLTMETQPAARATLLPEGQA